MPHEGNVFQEKLNVGHFILNGNGEMTGFARNRNAGTLETPIFLTGTANIGIVYDAALTYLLRENPEIGVTEHVPVPVVAECWDGMGDTEGRHITQEGVLQAIGSASGGPVDEGAVGGGTGMRSYGFKAGIGTSSRVLSDEQGGYTVGVLVNANHGGRRLLRIDGVPVGRELMNYPEDEQQGKSKSIIMVAATDAPMLPVQLQRLCKRMALGLARTGSVSTHGSGDIFIAFSTGNRITNKSKHIRCVDDSAVSRLWYAAVEAAEEAILNALTAAPSMDGIDGVVRHGLPLERVVQIMKKYKRLSP
jgi:D-aminopeptidase